MLLYVHTNIERNVFRYIQIWAYHKRQWRYSMVFAYTSTYMLNDHISRTHTHHTRHAYECDTLNRHTYVHATRAMLHLPTRQPKHRFSTPLCTLDIVLDLFRRAVSESRQLCEFGKSKTVTSRDIQTAVRLVLPGELAKFAVSEVVLCRCYYIII